MIQRCPNCGQWCITEESGLLNRFGEGFDESGEKLSRILGGEDPGVISTFVGHFFGTYTGAFKGAYKALFDYKYKFHCPNCGHEWGTDDEWKDETEEYIREIEQQHNELYSSVEAKIDECINSNHPMDAIKYLESLIGIMDDEDKREIAYLYRKQAVIYNNYIEDYEAALTACRKGLNVLVDEDWSSENTILLYYIYKSESNLGKTWAARRDALAVYSYAKDEVLSSDKGDEVSLEEEALKDFNRLDNEYADNYLQLDYKERKAFVTVSPITDVGTTHIDVFHISSVPKNISFPVGHPVVNQVYIGHPYLAENYLPLDTYQYSFVEDRVREFCEIAQALGATEITVEALNASNTSQNSSKDQLCAVSVSHADHAVGGSYHDNRGHSSVEEKYQALTFHQEYEPNEPVHLPEKMIWYPHEPGWQRLYQQRLKGILRHEERIETKKSQVLSGSELKEIKGEVKYIIEANGEWDDRMEERFVQEDNTVLSIKVKFAPLSHLTGNPILSTTALSTTEQEYLNEYKNMIEDGEIGPRERKTLERTRVRLGVSEARAKELEAPVTMAKMTDIEKEYFEEVKLVLEDGTIGPRERKYLERTRVRLGIGEERAKEIESSI